MTLGEPQGHGQLSLPDGPEWKILREMLRGLLNQTRGIEIFVRGDRAVIRGRVFSVDVLTSIRNLVALHAPTTGADDEMTWEPLYGADPGDDAAVPAGRVERHPFIKPLGQAQKSRRFDILVDLAMEASEYTTGGFSLNSDRAWSRLEIAVVIDPDGIAIPDEQRRKVVTLHADGSSSPALFSGIVTSDREVKVRLHFAHEGSDCGYAETTVAVAPSSTSDRKVRPAVVNYVAIEKDRPAASLTIRIRNEASERKWHWSFEVSPNLRGKVSADVFATTHLDDTAKGYFERQFMECPTLAPGRHVQKLRGIGEAIWRASPPQLHELYASIREIAGPGFPIQLITDEPYVPWELMFPEHPRVHDPAHILLEHPIARSFTGTGPRTLDFPKGRRVSFVPIYPFGDDLPAAHAEADWMVSEIGAEKGQATYECFDAFLRSPQTPRIQLVHFAGHGAAERQSDHGLWFGSNDWMQVEEINGSVRLGNEHRPFFALNACQAGQSSSSLGAVAGWPTALTSRGFGGVMAPLWSVEDNEASLFVQAFLQAFMVEGQSLGESAKMARVKYASLSANAHAYLVYGDVMARAEV